VGRQCSVCASPDRAAIDHALAIGDGYRGISRQYRVTPDAVGRHASRHLPVALVTAAVAADQADALDLVAKVRGYVIHAESILTDARAIGKPTLALAALASALSCISALAKLTGQIDERTTVNVLATSPQFVQLQSAVLAALAPFPEALAAVKTELVRMTASS
jgi:hypothetical protein